MIREDISTFCIQEETWEPGFGITSIRGYLVFQQNLSLVDTWKKRTKTKHTQGGIRKGVAIVLSPEFAEAFHRAGDIRSPSQTNQISTQTDSYELTFNSTLSTIKLNGSISSKEKNTNIFLSSSYHPWELELYDEFNDTITEMIFNRVPQTSSESLAMT